MRRLSLMDVVFNSVLFFIVFATISAGQRPDVTTTTTTTTTATTTSSSTTEFPTPTSVPTTTTSTPTVLPTVTTSPPTEPPAPPAVVAGTWTVTEPGKTDPCLMAHFGLALVVPYATTSGMVFNGTVAVPPDASSNGTCDALVLTWPGANSAGPANRLTLTFVRAHPDNESDWLAFRPAALTAAVAADPARFPGAAETGPFQLAADLPAAASYMSAPVNKSYRCDAERFVAANATVPAVQVGGKNATGYFVFRDVQMQPYMPPTPGHRFSTPVTCAADRPGGTASKVVPIAVGCALGALVVIVIFAYILGRRRSRQRGYGSV